MRDKQFSTDKIKIIKQGLPYGSIRRIAVKLSFSEVYITKVLSGEYYNAAIICEAVRIYQKKKEECRQLEKVIDKALEAKK